MMISRAGPLADLAADPARPLEPGPAEALAQRAVAAALAAGATYADAHLTRVVSQGYQFNDPGMIRWAALHALGIGVRVLVHGSWGYAASPVWDADEAARLANEAAAVAQVNAQVNAQGAARVVELGRYPAVTGRWAMPAELDPFAVPLEEKYDHLVYWQRCATQAGVTIDPVPSRLQCTRQERVTATSEGTCVTQTTYETGGQIIVQGVGGPPQAIDGLGVTGRGWELFLTADIPEQLRQMPARMRARAALEATRRPATIGQHTLLCDGATMATLTAHTLGIATQLDRALGYEANAGGTSYLDDPLGMVGQEKVTSPLVTLTADRSMEHGLATVKWDEEGVEPDMATLVKDGVLQDFQTTRESSAWLAEYYAKVGRPVRSHGYAAAQSALVTPLQHMPNLTLTPASGGVAEGAGHGQGASLDTLVAGVGNGVLVTNGTVQTDFQAKSGLLLGELREIRNGQLGPLLSGGAVLFRSAALWQNVTALGGTTTVATVGTPQHLGPGALMMPGAAAAFGEGWRLKGQPVQLTGHSARAPAAVISAQAIIDPMRKA